MDTAIFTLRIEGITPADLPMRRLAAYLDEFARLLGEEASTRLESVSEGSTNIASRPLPMAVPKVRMRLAAARDGASKDACRSMDKLDAMLSDDNTSGTLIEEGRSGILIRFPGVNARAAKLPIITETGSLQGVLIRIGGGDQTAHALLRDDDTVRSCTVSHDLARALGKHLYGPPLRLIGRGRWKRTPRGEWELEDFRASDFEVLDNASLIEAAQKLRAAGGFGYTSANEAWAAFSEQRAE